MPFRFLDDVAIADTAVEVTEPTLEKLFSTAADALLQVQTENLDDVRPEVEETVRVEHGAADLLLYRFLQELIYLKDARRLLLRAGHIQIDEGPRGLQLTAKMSGEPLDPARHTQGVDVKAVTFHLFEVSQTLTGWKATLVFDI